MPDAAPAVDWDGPPPGPGGSAVAADPAVASLRAAKQEAEWAVHGEAPGNAVAWLPGQTGTSPLNNPDAQEMLHGASAGFSDDIGAHMYASRVAVKNSMLVAQGKKPRYTAEQARQAYLEAVREQRKQHEAQHPILSGLESFGGSFLTPGLSEADAALTARGVPAFLRSMGLGGLMGGASAAGNTQGTTGHRAGAAPLGAVEGTVSGLFMHLTTKLGAKFVSNLAPAIWHGVKEAWEHAALSQGWKPGQPITAEMRAKGEAAAMTYVKEVSQRLDPTGEKLNTNPIEARSKASAQKVNMSPQAVEQRAKAAGFSIKAYHGTPHDFTDFQHTSLGGSTNSEAAREGFFFTDQTGGAEGANRYSTQYVGQEGANVRPVRLRMRNPARGSYSGPKPMAQQIRDARAAGHDGMIISGVSDSNGGKTGNHYVIFDPKNVRSSFDSFAPESPPNHPTITAAEALGRTGEAKLKAAMRQSGTTGDEARAQLTARRRAGADRIVQDFATHTGIDPAAVEGNFDAQLKSMRAAAAPEYAKAFAHTEVDSPELQRILKRVEDTKAVSEAYAIAKLEGRDPEELGLVVVSGKQPVRLADGSLFTDQKGNPIMMDHEQTVEVRHPSLETWDYIKRGLQRVIYADGNKLPGGKLDLDDKERAMNGALNDLRTALTDPGTAWGHDYAQALAKGGEAPRLKEAWGNASKMMRATMSPYDFNKTVAEYTPSQVEGLKAGVLRDIHNAAIADTPRAKATHLGEMSTEAYKLKLTRLFGKEKAEALVQSVKDEAELIERGNFILRGSDTAENTAAMTEQDKALEDITAAAHIGKQALKGHWISALLSGIAHLADSAKSRVALPMAEIERNEVGRLLLLKPSELAAEIAKQAPGVTPSQAQDLAAKIGAFVRAGGPELQTRLSAMAGGGVAGAMAPSDQPSADKAPPKAPGASKDEAPDWDGPPPTSDGLGGPPPKADGAASPAPASAAPARSPSVEPAAFTSTAHAGQYLQGIYGRPVEITSGYRDPAHNAEVGGVPGSAHTKGLAYDFKVPGVPMQEAAMMLARSGKPFDLIEITPTHVHVSFDPQNRGKIIYGGGYQQSAPRPTYAAYQPPSQALGSSGAVDWAAIDNQP